MEQKGTVWINICVDQPGTLIGLRSVPSQRGNHYDVSRTWLLAYLERFTYFISIYLLWLIS
jgi:hypothetical protein